MDISIREFLEFERLLQKHSLACIAYGQAIKSDIDLDIAIREYLRTSFRLFEFLKCVTVQNLR